MYRSKWIEEIMAGRSVLQVALDVHMTARGSLSRDQVQQERDLAALGAVIATWKNPGVCDFDDLVLKLVCAAVAEAYAEV